MYRLLLIIPLIFLVGCAMLEPLVETATEVKGEEIQTQASALQIVLNDLVPLPYRVPASVGLGYLLCLLRRIWKKKHGSKK